MFYKQHNRSIRFCTPNQGRLEQSESKILKVKKSSAPTMKLKRYE